MNMAFAKWTSKNCCPSSRGGVESRQFLNGSIGYRVDKNAPNNDVVTATGELSSLFVLLQAVLQTP
jgi:hypothetical protein